MRPQDQRDSVRARFTRTAEQFARFSLSRRNKEADQLLQLAAPRGDEQALDLACGPGTFLCAFAPRVAHICGLDLTPALLAQAEQAARELNLANYALALGDAHALPMPDESQDLVVCAYSVHHFGEPPRALAEVRRVLRRGGRLALVDIVVPEGCDPAANNAIERVRDASHATTLTAAEFAAHCAAAGLKINVSVIGTRERSFHDWLRIAGWEPGSAAHEQAYRLMAAQAGRDTTGFVPRLQPDGDLAFTQTSLFLIAEPA